ncbi:hypothetical protein FRC08_001827 [Ceratobasidium sp. 394]|nr:hypothetical protein FRC08_001827 [Ceratobasidium sp. 394]
MLATDGDDVDWTYVVDLDNRAFTINGLMHFRLDNMPPGSLNAYLWRIPSPEYPGETCIPTYAHPPSTPVEYIATVSRWPPPHFNVSQTCEEYAQLAPIVLSTNDWGAPTWSSLTIVQQLSATLVQTILLDSAEKMANPDVVKMQPAFDICRWQLLSAAAPSHLCCPPEPSTSEKARNPRALSIEELREGSAYLSCLTPHYSKPRSWERPDFNLTCYWFRGCLVAFRPRLDQVEYVKHETVKIVQNLRKYGRTTGIGVVFTGQHILAISLDGDTVRCSHPLLFHDMQMQCKDGFLLATHLLSPLLTADKAPWARRTSDSKLIAPATTRLPKELLRQIIFLLDHDSYLNLARVSRLFREMYASYPRVGDHMLLRRIDNYNYIVHDTVTGAVSAAYLQRSAPFQSYYETLVHSFQRIAFGPPNLYPNFDYYRQGIIRGAESEQEVQLVDRAKWRGDGWLPIRVQAVHGIWHFVDPAIATSNFPVAMEYDEERDREPLGSDTLVRNRWL